MSFSRLKAKRKGPRYVVRQHNGADEIYDSTVKHDAPLSWWPSDVARLLNAGERARQQVKRLKAEVERLQEELQMDRMCE